MAEYIDRELVCENCNNKNHCEKAKCPVYKVSTACVVAKNEVQRLVGKYYDKCDECRKKYAKAVALEIFEEIEVKLNAFEYHANAFNNTVTVELLKSQIDWLLHEVVPHMLVDLKYKYLLIDNEINVADMCEEGGAI